MSSRELSAWIAFYRVEAEEHAKARDAGRPGQRDLLALSRSF